jgi:hypothetical protein
LALLGKPTRARRRLGHGLAQIGALPDESQRSPASGLPLMCCRIRALPIVTSDDASDFR